MTKTSHTMITMFASALLMVPITSVQAQQQQVQPVAPEPGSEAQHYSVRTTKIGTLLDDPAARAILERLIPAVYANEMFQSMGREQTLVYVQQFEPVALSDANLALIQAELDKLPPRG